MNLIKTLSVEIPFYHEGVLTQFTAPDGLIKCLPEDNDVELFEYLLSMESPRFNLEQILNCEN